MMYGGWGWGAGWMMIMPLVWLVLIGVVVWAVVRLARPGGGEVGPAGTATTQRESPQEILDRRLATGEIDLETYTRTRDLLAGRERGS